METPTPTPVPALKPPPGHVAFGHDTTLWKWNLVCVSVCLSVTTLLFVARLYTRVLIRREWMFEDYMATFAWLGLVTYCVLMTTVMLHHGGVHSWDLTIPEAQSALYWFNITSIEYGICILTCKLTILSIYRRVFLPHHLTQKSLFHLILRLLEGILIAFYISITIIKIFECNPRERIWNRSIPGTCININAMLNSSGMFNFLTDVLILLVPVKSVWGLNMSKGKKVRVVAVFTFGLIAPIFSMIGFLAREEIARSLDVTFNQPLALLWAAAEVSTGVICICLPPLSSLFHGQNPRQPKGPTQSIINGLSNRNSATRVSRRKGTMNLDDDDDLLESGYLELQDGVDIAGNKSGDGGMGEMKGNGRNGDREGKLGGNGEWKGVVVTAGAGADPDSGTGIGADPAAGVRKEERGERDILKTVRVENSYKELNVSRTRNIVTGLGS